MVREAAKTAGGRAERALCGSVVNAVARSGWLVLAAATASMGGTMYETDAHRTLLIPLALTNTAERVQGVASVRTTCGCVTVDLAEGREAGPGEIMDFVAEYRAPFSGDGEVAERVSVTLAPSGTTVDYPVRVKVRRRLGLEPPVVAFGVVGREQVGCEAEVRLEGYAAGDVSLAGAEGGHAFAVRPQEDGRSLWVGFAEASPHPGLYAETWTVRTNDPELPVLKLRIRARVADRKGGDDFGSGHGRISGRLAEAGEDRR